MPQKWSRPPGNSGCWLRVGVPAEQGLAVVAAALVVLVVAQAGARPAGRPMGSLPQPHRRPGHRLLNQAQCPGRPMLGHLQMFRGCPGLQPSIIHWRLSAAPARPTVAGHHQKTPSLPPGWHRACWSSQGCPYQPLAPRLLALCLKLCRRRPLQPGRAKPQMARPVQPLCRCRGRRLLLA
jgi:hypothetical protein